MAYRRSRRAVFVRCDVVLRLFYCQNSARKCVYLVFWINLMQLYVMVVEIHRRQQVFCNDGDGDWWILCLIFRETANKTI